MKYLNFIHLLSIQIIFILSCFNTGLCANSNIELSSSAQYNNWQESYDPRIKNYVFSEDRVYTLRLYDKFQSHIVFAKNEEIKNISLGESYAFKINVLGNRIFIKPLEENVHTNMTVITNKRAYEFEILVEKISYEKGSYPNLAYVIKFIYPRNNHLNQIKN